ncbi:MAG: hypothetical protein SGJ01_12950 [Gemmatimonadota bacterium]|nr:hypothetical protein [Gemmatimonadota bacterium]
MSRKKKPSPKPDASTAPVPPRHAAGALIHPAAETDRPDIPALEGGEPLPEELTGRASGTSEDLTALFDNTSAKHLSDGFHGRSADDPDAVDRGDGVGES